MLTTENGKIWIPDKSNPEKIAETIEVKRARPIFVPGKVRMPDQPIEKNGNLKAPADGLGS